MAREKSRASLLSAQLDFEDIRNPGAPVEPPDELAHLQFDVDKEAIQTENKSGKTPVILRSPAELVKERLRQEQLERERQKAAKADNFAFYAAIVALLSFVAIFSVIFYAKFSNNENKPSYLALPQTVVNLDGQVIRMQVNIQVANADREWLAKHKQELTEMFPITMTTIAPEDLKTEEGLERIREQMRTDLNQRLATDKVQSVLLNELLTQSH
ncbi:flagellar basal body-associated FliL family protein [Undibacterium sp. CY7W]|uniref:Flagellar protein FliL n=1 Tax=Undibacterium rugosum TaxID=2762291 RepID=A0A923I497_9BURK|nr:flagellar basal body-associated FliL family protein [Undibacterium rugosum]MBC3936085.1 flagellar basal body-associated FliL family protein [Undibacterium rugosum]